MCYVGQGLLGLYMACLGILELLGSRMSCELEFEIRSILGFICCVCVCGYQGYMVCVYILCVNNLFNCFCLLFMCARPKQVL
jgi:hypothetical protein